MKKLKLNLSNLPGAEILTRQQLKKIVGGVMSEDGGGCVIVASDQGFQSCWYIRGNDFEGLCTRVYGSHCCGASHGYIDCDTNNCTMN